MTSKYRNEYQRLLKVVQQTRYAVADLRDNGEGATQDWVLAIDKHLSAYEKFMNYLSDAEFESEYNEVGCTYPDCFENDDRDTRRDKISLLVLIRTQELS